MCFSTENQFHIPFQFKRSFHLKFIHTQRRQRFHKTVRQMLHKSRFLTAIIKLLYDLLILHNMIFIFKETKKKCSAEIHVIPFTMKEKSNGSISWDLQNAQTRLIYEMVQLLNNNHVKTRFTQSVNIRNSEQATFLHKNNTRSRRLCLGISTETLVKPATRYRKEKN